jgi:hypothetical protein
MGWSFRFLFESGFLSQVFFFLLFILDMCYERDHFGDYLQKRHIPWRLLVASLSCIVQSFINLPCPTPNTSARPYVHDAHLYSRTK